MLAVPHQCGLMRSANTSLTQIMHMIVLYYVGCDTPLQGQIEAMTVENVIIIGSGPAGMTAAIYAGRANLSPLVLTGAMVGGQPSITNEIENYPGFPEGTTGAELVEKVHRQAQRFGTRMEYDEAIEADLRVHPFRVKTYGNEYQAKTVIVASGASSRKLGVPGEVELIGHGVSYCGTCDGFFFRGREIVVVGGGDSALEETLFLTRFASRVRLIHRRDQLRAGYILQERARRNEKIEFVWNSVITQINGSSEVESVTLQNTVTGAELGTAHRGRLRLHRAHTQQRHLPWPVDHGRGRLHHHRQADPHERGGRVCRRRGGGPGVSPEHHLGCRGARAAIEANKWLAELEDRAYPGT